MRTPSLKPRLLALVTLATWVVAAGCRPKPPETPPAPVPQPPEVGAAQQPSPQGDAPSMAAASADSAATAASLVDSTGSPSTTHIHTVSAATVPDGIPRLEDMQLAAPGSKLGVPVDLRYRFDAPVEAGRPATLHLAAVPRVPGSNLTVSVKESAGIDAVAAPITAQKAAAKQAYRQQLAVTRHAGAPEELRVLVTMDLPEGSAFSYFSVPFANARVAAAAAK